MTNRGRTHIMSNWKTALLAGAMACAPVQAFAAPTEAPLAETVAPAEEDLTSPENLENAKAKMQREMDQAIAMVEKFFDTSNLPPIDPARLALARQSTAALLPAGSLEKMVDNLYGKAFDLFLAEMDGASPLMLSIKTGVESDKIEALDDKSKTAIADLFDPHRKERGDQILKVVKPLISEALADLEPPMREGLAKAYARKFSAPQLTEMNAFFATPTGKLYASESMALGADPEVMLATIKAVPPMITKFIDRAPQIEGQLKELPKEKQLTDLSDAEIAKLAKLMKVDAKTLKETRDNWTNPAVEEAVDAGADWNADDASAADAAADAAAAAADAAGEWDPAYERANWSAADLKRVEDAESALEAASTAAYDAEQAAIANARKKKK
ncbi:hypothetical protein ATE67_00510 [Sphingopyxis sp. H050]|nr:hypothetical protein ATE67_00510 [Sphingopyxis sp. H050]